MGCRGGREKEEEWAGVGNKVVSAARTGCDFMQIHTYTIEIIYTDLSFNSHYFCAEPHIKPRNYTSTRKRLFAEWYEQHNMPAPAKGPSWRLLMIIKVNYLLV